MRRARVASPHDGSDAVRLLATGRDAGHGHFPDVRDFTHNMGQFALDHQSAGMSDMRKRLRCLLAESGAAPGAVIA